MPDVDHFSDSEESFHSFDDDETSPPAPPPQHSPTHSQHQDHDRRRRPSHHDRNDAPPSRPVIERFDPEEEASLLAESNSLKGSANQLFGKGSFENAIQTYDKALSSCPNYLDYEIAILRSNVAACHIKLEEWKEAVESATKGVDCLERLEPLPQPKAKPKARGKDGDGQQAAIGDADEKQIVEVGDDLEDRIANLQRSGRTVDEVRKLQVKLLTRRAKANTEVGGWASLQGADEDYKMLLSPVVLPFLSSTDQRQTVDAARSLVPKLNAAKDGEMAEMMGKMKGLGNSILSPFGLSTENFQFVKDEKSGGYSMNFEQNPGKKG